MSAHLPYFLFSLPQNTIIDLMRGRMVLINFVNTGRLTAGIEHGGYEVSHPSGRNDLGRDSLVVSAVIDDNVGRLYRVELHNIHRHVEEMIMEFRPLGSLLNVIDGMREAAKLTIPKSS